MDEKDGLLRRIAKSLGAGRDQRRNDLLSMGENIQTAMSSYEGKGALQHERRMAPLFDSASARGFLTHVDIEDRAGKETRVENAEVKEREPYQKRPSVRALKAAKRKYPRPQM